jgi:phosphoglycerate dehydrogenase-like enzyme
MAADARGFTQINNLGASAAILSATALCYLFVPALTLLVVGDPAASYLKPLARLPGDTRIVVSSDPERLKQVAPEADVLLNGDFRDPALFLETFRHATRVRWIHSPGAGVERVLSNEIVSSPVPLTNGRGMFARPLGEWIMAAMLYFTYDLYRVLKDQEAHRWRMFEHDELHGRTLAIVGFGAIGRAAAERAEAFGMKILTIRRGEAAKIPDVLAQSDFVAVTAPLTKETRGMIGAREIAAMKPTAVMIHVGRGAVIDEGALIAALRSNQIRGAALDVFETEPLPPDHPFYSLQNVLLSPHSADALPESRGLAIQFFVENFERFHNGEPLQNIVDKHAGY